MIQVKSIRWGANVELRGRESQRRIEGDGILYDEHTGNVEVDDDGCRAIVVPPQGTVIVLGKRLQVGEVEAVQDGEKERLKRIAETGSGVAFPVPLLSPAEQVRRLHNEPPRSPTSTDPPPARPVKARR